MLSLTQGFKGTKKDGVYERLRKGNYKGSSHRSEERQKLAISPVSPHAFLRGAELMAGRREALSPIPVIVTIFTPTAALPATVPLSGIRRSNSK